MVCRHTILADSPHITFSNRSRMARDACIEPNGTGHMVHGAWFMVHGSWFMVHRAEWHGPHGTGRMAQDARIEPHGTFSNRSRKARHRMHVKACPNPCIHIHRYVCSLYFQLAGGATRHIHRLYCDLSQACSLPIFICIFSVSQVSGWLVAARAQDTVAVYPSHSQGRSVLVVATAVSQRHAAACVSAVQWQVRNRHGWIKMYVLVNDYSNVTTPCSSRHVCVCQPCSGR